MPRTYVIRHSTAPRVCRLAAFCARSAQRSKSTCSHSCIFWCLKSTVTPFKLAASACRWIEATALQISTIVAASNRVSRCIAQAIGGSINLGKWRPAAKGWGNLLAPVGSRIPLSEQCALPLQSFCVRSIHCTPTAFIQWMHWTSAVFTS